MQLAKQISVMEGLGRSSMYFSDLELLYNTMDKEEVAATVKSMPCLISFIKADIFVEAMQFVEYINSLPGNAAQNRIKYIILMTPYVDETHLQNRTSNINVHIIQQDKPGTSHDDTVYLFTFAKFKLILTGGEGKITSLCPVLGNRYSVIRPGMCPPDLQQLRGKEIGVANAGPPPYLIRSKNEDELEPNGLRKMIGGTSFLIMDIFATKFDFELKMISKQNSFDGKDGEVATVRVCCNIMINVQ